MRYCFSAAALTARSCAVRTASGSGSSSPSQPRVSDAGAAAHAGAGTTSAAAASKGQDVSHREDRARMLTITSYTPRTT